MADKKAAVHPDFAVKVMGALPDDLRKSAELKKGGGEYTILRVRGKSVASIRDKNVRIVHPHGGTAAEATALGKLIAKAAPAEAPKPKAAKKAAKAEAKKAEGAGGKEGDAK
ncbi:MAG: hypothetical protein ACRDP6_00210 [Actinoallomurus sp.]